MKCIGLKVFDKALRVKIVRYASKLLQAIAMDGKMICDHGGTLTAADHEPGAPGASAIQDREEGPIRCGQVGTLELIIGWVAEPR